MGLDMFLTKETYFFNDGKKSLKIEGVKGIKPERVKYIIEEIGYWRKANAIHQWFVANVQEGKDDCQKYFVTKEDLTKLLDVVTQVQQDHSKASVLLPTQSGFFFGGVGYDEYYFEDLEDTKEIIEQALLEESKYFYYQSSW